MSVTNLHIKREREWQEKKSEYNNILNEFYIRFYFLEVLSFTSHLVESMHRNRANFYPFRAKCIRSTCVFGQIYKYQHVDQYYVYVCICYNTQGNKQARRKKTRKTNSSPGTAVTFLTSTIYQFANFTISFPSRLFFFFCNETQYHPLAWLRMVIYMCIAYVSVREL